MVKKKQDINSLKICMQHNHKNIKINSIANQKSFLHKNFSVFKKNKILTLYILKKKNFFQLLKNV
jgi:hypothetical protein